MLPKPIATIKERACVKWIDRDSKNNRLEKHFESNIIGRWIIDTVVDTGESPSITETHSMAQSVGLKCDTDEIDQLPFLQMMNVADDIDMITRRWCGVDFHIMMLDGVIIEIDISGAYRNNRAGIMMKLLISAAVYNIDDTHPIDRIGVLSGDGLVTVDISRWDPSELIGEVEIAMTTLSLLAGGDIYSHHSGGIIHSHHSGGVDHCSGERLYIPMLPVGRNIHNRGSKGESGLYTSLSEFWGENPELPVQLFLAGNMNSRKVNISGSIISRVSKMVDRHGYKFFIHASYLINLCNTKHLHVLIDELDIGDRSGCRGVVVHVGKWTGLQDEEEGVMRMRENLYKVLPHIGGCRLLIETAAGQGNELLTNIDDLREFISEFPEEKVGVCLDTCHVFSAGYSPVDALRTLDRVELIHWNDSRWPMGCCKDRHAFPGRGRIGSTVMMIVAEMADERGIPLVIE